MKWFRRRKRKPKIEYPKDYCPATGGSCDTCITYCIDYGRPGSIGMG